MAVRRWLLLLLAGVLTVVSVATPAAAHSIYQGPNWIWTQGSSAGCATALLDHNSSSFEFYSYGERWLSYCQSGTNESQYCASGYGNNCYFYGRLWRRSSGGDLLRASFGMGQFDWFTWVNFHANYAGSDVYSSSYSWWSQARWVGPGVPDSMDNPWVSTYPNHDHL